LRRLSKDSKPVLELGKCSGVYWLPSFSPPTVSGKMMAGFGAFYAMPLAGREGVAVFPQRQPVLAHGPSGDDRVHGDDLIEIVPPAFHPRGQLRALE
jgi:hypothetical protein